MGLPKSIREMLVSWMAENFRQEESTSYAHWATKFADFTDEFSKYTKLEKYDKKDLKDPIKNDINKLCKARVLQGAPGQDGGESPNTRSKG